MEWLIYLLKVSTCTVLFFAFYLLVLRKLTFFKINRVYLLLSLLLSFTIPALEFTIERESMPMISNTSTMLSSVELGMPIEALPATTVDATNAIHISNADHFNWLGLLLLVYYAIVAGFFGLTIWRLFQLFDQANANCTQINGLKIVSKTNGFTNCSFFNYVFIDENSLSETELQVLLAHEIVHVRQFHSLDKIILKIMKAILWFNPIIYLYDKELEQAHEYEADQVASRVVGAKHYANLLLSLAVSKSSMPLVHNFVKSPLKQRIKMLFNLKSKNMKKLMYLFALPIGLLLTLGFTVKVVTQLPDSEQKNKEEALSNTSFISIKRTNFVDGKPAIIYDVKSPNGKRLRAIGEENLVVKFLINGKLYSLAEAEHFDQAFIKKLSSNQGLNSGYDLKENNVNDNEMLFWFGKKPQKNISAIKSAEASLKYSGEIIYGKVIAYGYAQRNTKVMDGFIIKQNSGELIKIYIDPKFAVQVNKQLKIGDEMKIKAFNGYFRKDGQYPEIGSSTVVRDGKVIFDRNRFVIDDRKENVKTVAHTLAEIAYNTADSVKFSRDRKTVDLYGGVELSLDSIKLIAAHVNVNNHTRIVTARNARITSPYSDLKVKGNTIHYNLNTKKYTVEK